MIYSVLQKQVLATSTTVAVLKLSEFNISHNSCYDRFQKILINSRQSTVYLVYLETMTGATYSDYIEISFSNKVTKMLVIYVKEPFP